LRRIIHNQWFIQSEKGETQYIAWASKVRTKSPLEFTEPIYFNFGETEIEAINKVKDEVDKLSDENR
jgi:hypothetical protein